LVQLRIAPQNPKTPLIYIIIHNICQQVLMF